MDEFDKDEVKRELYKRWRKLTIKQIGRDLDYIIGLIGQGIGLLVTMGLVLISIFLDMLKMMQNFMNVNMNNPDPFSLFNGFQLFTLDKNYLTWIIPVSIFLICWTCYRLTKSRNEPDILLEAFKSTMVTMGFRKAKKEE